MAAQFPAQLAATSAIMTAAASPIPARRTRPARTTVKGSSTIRAIRNTWTGAEPKAE